MPKAKGQPNLTKASFEAAARQHKWEFKNAAQAPQGDRTWIYKCGGDVTIMHWATTGTVNLVLKGKCTHWAWNPEENWNKDCYTKTDEHLTSDDVYAILADPEAFTGKRYEARKDTTELLCRVEKHPENDPLQSDVGRMGIYRSAAGS